jgi:hypothetical protein
MPIKVFIKCWVFYWLLILIAPFRSAVGAAWSGPFVQSVFFISVIGGYFLLDNNFKTERVMPSFPKPPNVYVQLFWLSITISLVGSFFMTFDRMIIQGISFSHGLAVAREKWRIAGEERGGSISSIYSILGYLCAPAFYYSIINLSIYKNAHEKKIKFKWLLILLMIVWNTILTGGRSVAFVALIMFVSSQIYNHQFFVKESVGWVTRIFQRSSLIINKSNLLRTTIILLLLSYSLYVFKSRSVAGSIDVKSYVTIALNDLGLQIYPSVDALLIYVPFAELIYLSILMLGYLLHSYVVVAQIYNYPYENHSLVIFSGIGLILAKLGVISTPNTDWFLAGTFASLPGSLYLQGGFKLLILFGLVLGFSVRLVSLLIYKYRYNSTLIFVYIILLSIMLTSPVLFVFDSLMFPFILIQFAIFSILLRLRLR